jgi:hypothetical protein
MRVVEWRGSGEYANKNRTVKIDEVCRLHLIKVKICCRHGLELVCKNAGCQFRSVCQRYECLLLKLEHAGISGNSALLGGSFSRNRSLAEVVKIGHALLATTSAWTSHLVGGSTGRQGIVDRSIIINIIALGFGPNLTTSGQPIPRNSL